MQPIKGLAKSQMTLQSEPCKQMLDLFLDSISGATPTASLDRNRSAEELSPNLCDRSFKRVVEENMSRETASARLISQQGEERKQAGRRLPPLQVN